MNDLEKEIADRIRDGSYFDDGHDWYMKQYLNAVTERSFLIILAIVFFSCAVLLIINWRSIIEQTPQVELPIKVPHTQEYFSYIKPIADKDEGTQEAMAKYFIRHYINAREQYYPEEMRGEEFEYKMKKIKSSSSKKVLNEYINYMNDLNPYSPISRYKDHTTRKIKIRKFNFIGDDMTTGRVKVIFDAIVTERKKTEQQLLQESEDDTKKKKNNDNKTTSRWEATVHFRLPDIETIARTGAPLRFIVKYYRARLIK
jgi:type IV secretory pathway component VirB8